MFRSPPPERRRRGDLVAAAVLVLLLGGAVMAVAAGSEIAATTSRPAAGPVTAPPDPAAAPASLTEAWRAPSAATTDPVVAGPVAVTAGGSTVLGRDARTGSELWSYARDLPLCTVGAGFPALDGGQVLALYAGGFEAPTTGDGPYCSELTMLRGETGERTDARHPDSRPGVRLLADDTYVLAIDPTHIEVWRSDLVRTLEYGTVPAQEQVGRQPRPDCTYSSAALGDRSVGVVEQCPGEAGERLTVLAVDGEHGAEKPEERWSVLLAAGATDAQVVAVTEQRAAVVRGGRLAVLDAAGTELDGAALDALTCAPEPPEPDVLVAGADVAAALDACTLAPRWTLSGALGAPVRYGTDLLVPVADGLQVLDPATGEPRRLLAVPRTDPTAPVGLAVLGDVVLEQRGAEVVALAPP